MHTLLGVVIAIVIIGVYSYFKDGRGQRKTYPRR
ncbi:Flp pilus assembly pilin Flp [Paenibacillus endophyticus]|uniref:Flp pilus assembly pilin Flp n=1 Tax=Paenibacillus endophyticus TaxID=1294268 RepID=A0A7W5GCF5_9BACL|nr:Flp pilus assembly pilin Flp [Paenibacillus endophyticus]